MAANAVATTEHLRLLAKVARLYFEAGLKQREICEALHLSQPRVSRLLKEAEQRGIVRSIVEIPEGLHIIIIMIAWLGITTSCILHR